MIKCYLCGKSFCNNQALSKHLNSKCYLNKNKKQRTLETQSDVSVLHVMPSSEIAIVNFNTHSSVTSKNMKSSNAIDTDTDTIKSQISISQLTSCQKILMNQEQKHYKNTKVTNCLWSNDDLGKLDLINILQKHNCHNSVYKDILQWHNHYQNHDKKFTSLKQHETLSREYFMNKLTHMQDMTKMKPYIETITVSATDKINVTVFDFKQQLLSLLRDEKIMQPSNLLLDKMETVSTNTQSNIISDIHDGAWYQSSLDYYNNLYGPDPTRLICGIILTVDKTHTDWKGKLCLEPVQFTLAIFDKEIRKRNSNCWRCLGYINDLEGYNMKKLYTENSHNLDTLYSMSVNTSETNENNSIMNEVSRSSINCVFINIYLLINTFYLVLN